MVASTSKKLHEVCSVRHQTSPLHVLATTMHRWYPRGRRQDVDADPVGVHDRVSTDIKGVHMAFERIEGRRDILRLSYFGRGDLEADRVSRCLNALPIKRGSRGIDVEHDRQPA